MKKLLVMIGVFVGSSLISYASQVPAKTIVINPADNRPVTNEYIAYQGECIGAEVVTTDKILNDNYLSETMYIPGNAAAIREQMDTLVSAHNDKDTTVIINMASYLNGGLTATRFPTTYNEKELVISRLETLIKNTPNPNIYINVNTPRTKPEIRGFYWAQDKQALGYEYFVKGKDSKTRFDEVIFQYSYVKVKSAYEPLTLAEQQFKNYFEENFISNCPEELKINGVPMAVAYQKMFTDSKYIIDQLVRITKQYGNVELVIGIDDFKLPNTLELDGAETKYNYAHNIIQTLEKEQVLGHTRINIAYGYDDINQLIVARDNTKRTQIGNEYIIRYVQGATTGEHVGAYDAENVAAILDHSTRFVNEYAMLKKNTYMVYVHNSDIKENMLTTAQAKALVDEMKQYPNVLLLDLKTNGVDTNLMEELNRQLFPIKSYSGWNTIANAIGLGIAHAQVCECPNTQCKLFTQHIYEDWIYNTMYKGEKDLQKLKEEFMKHRLNLPYTVKNITRPYSRVFECYLEI